MSLESVTDAIRQRLSRAGGLRARAKFDFGDDGLVLVDTTEEPPVITHEDAESDVTFVTTLTTFEAILAGTQDPTLAFMTGKLKVRGSMGLALKLNGILEN